MTNSVELGQGPISDMYESLAGWQELAEMIEIRLSKMLPEQWANVEATNALVEVWNGIIEEFNSLLEEYGEDVILNQQMPKYEWSQPLLTYTQKFTDGELSLVEAQALAAQIIELMEVDAETMDTLMTETY